jgi:hypothetical protein
MVSTSAHVCRCSLRFNSIFKIREQSIRRANNKAWASEPARLHTASPAARRRHPSPELEASSSLGGSAGPNAKQATTRCSETVKLQQHWRAVRHPHDLPRKPAAARWRPLSKERWPLSAAEPLVCTPCLHELHMRIASECTDGCLTGKSSLTVQFVDGHFVDSYYPTIENTFSKMIRYKNQEFATEIIDTAGQVREVFFSPRVAKLSAAPLHTPHPLCFARHPS